MAKSKVKYTIYGIFGLAVLFTAYWGFNFLKGSSIMKRTNTYYVYYDRIEGLTKSSIVNINGFQVGQVSDIEFLPQDNQRLKVKLEISNEFLLPTNSIAKITSTDLLGSKGIDLIFNKDATTYHKPNDVLKGEVEQSLKEQVSIEMLPIKNQAENLMKELVNIIEIISYIFNEETRDNLEKSFASIRATLFNIENSASTFDKMLTNESTQISKIISNIESLTSSLQKNNKYIDNVIKNFSNISDTIAKQNITQTFTQLNELVTKFNSIAQKVENGEGSAGKLLNDAKFATELENATENLNKLLYDIKANPKKYVGFSIININKKN